jgi:hypothetical protein
MLTLLGARSKARRSKDRMGLRVTTEKGGMEESKNVREAVRRAGVCSSWYTRPT